jgi:hypothetical protein
MPLPEIPSGNPWHTPPHVDLSFQMKIPTLPLIAALISVASLHADEKSPDSRVFELRTYHANPGKLEPLLTRFRDHTVSLFEKHGMTQIGYWLPVENKEQRLVFLLAYPDRASREASWRGFLGDTAWIKAAADSEKDGKLVSKVDQLFLTSTSFSPGFDRSAPDGKRLFELRTYTTPAGKLPALHARFRNHTLGLFAKHGMTNLAYFQPLPDQADAAVTLIYFLAHKDAESAAASFQSFRTDPIWLDAKQKSEDAAGGSLTVPDGVQSLLLTPTDFSPAR